MTHDEVQALAKALAPALKELRQEIVGEVLAQSLRYSGAHQRAATYSRNECTTHDGALWICTAKTTTALPGENQDWELMTGGKREN